MRIFPTSLLIAALSLWSCHRPTPTAVAAKDSADAAQSAEMDAASNRSIAARAASDRNAETSANAADARRLQSLSH
jgi:hypothetical protein